MEQYKYKKIVFPSNIIMNYYQGIQSDVVGGMAGKGHEFLNRNDITANQIEDIHYMKTKLSQSIVTKHVC